MLNELAKQSIAEISVVFCKEDEVVPSLVDTIRRPEFFPVSST